MKEIIATTGAPGAIGPYSQATKAGSLVFVSGQLPIDPATGVMARRRLRADEAVAHQRQGQFLKPPAARWQTS